MPQSTHIREHTVSTQNTPNIHFTRSIIGTRSVVRLLCAHFLCVRPRLRRVPEEIGGVFSGGRNFRSVDRIFVSVSHVRRAQSSRLDEVPNFLESRSASQSVFLVTIFRNSDIDAYRACGE